MLLVSVAHVKNSITCHLPRNNCRNFQVRPSASYWMNLYGGLMTALSKNARTAGFLYILSSVFGLVRLIYIPSTLLVSGNAVATTDNIAGHELLFRFGIVSYLLCSALWIFVTLALYRLLKGVDQTLARLMVIITVVITPIFFVNAGNDVAALLFARGTEFLSVLDPAQHEAFVMLFLNLHHQLDLSSGLIWILFHIPFGLLVYKSRFLPRILGVWLMMVGLAYLALSISGLLVPVYERKVWDFAQPVLFGEVAVMLWLAIMGAKEPRMAAGS